MAVEMTNPAAVAAAPGSGNRASDGRHGFHNSIPAGKIDFSGINRAALAALPAILDRWLPGGRREGPEYVVRNPRRADRRPGSFKVNLRSGAWADFATGDKGGDVVSLAAYLHGVGQADAARSLAKMLGVRNDG